MIPKRITIENFLSFGSPATEIVFGDDEPLWVLGGPNGVGKSAVFDAMTYSLYAEHRGGASDHVSLIRHGANGFRVVFEFEFNGTDYRITRNRLRSGRPTQRIERRTEGGWAPVEPPPAAGRQDPVRLWVVRTLGLDFDAFTASVLLRQGQADEIITATGGRRLAILKKIIGVERFEALSERVHGAARKCGGRLEDLRTRRDGLTPVTDAEVSEAGEALALAEKTSTATREAVAAAAERVTFATQWAKLDPRRRGLARQVTDADERAADADRIRRDKGRLDDLTTAAPTLRRLVALREGLAAAERKLTERQSDAQRIADALTAKQLREEIGREVKFIGAAEEARKLRDELGWSDSNISEQLAAVQECVRITTGAETVAVREKAAADGVLKLAQARRQKFATVGVGVPCSACGQEVTAKHADLERRRLAEEVQDLEQKAGGLEAEEAAAAKAKKAAVDERDRLGEAARTRDTTSNLLALKEQTLRDLGVSGEPDELRRQLADKSAAAERHETAAGDQSRADRPTLKKRLAEVEQKARADERTIDSGRGEQSTLLALLSSDWKARLADLNIAAVDALDGERRRLAESGAAKQFEQLEQDTALRDEWVRQLAAVEAEIAEVPDVARIPMTEAEEGLGLARRAGQAADELRDASKKTLDDLVRRAEQFRELIKDIAAAEKQANLHHKLDGLLGKGGLQRELVRTAEREIVRLANDTLQNLSDGDLSVELDDGAGGDDEAFALRVRPAAAPAPIGVNYLSGSQKFRVAVSVALAIGRFAAGQARPLESVIIDEGFGSLDRDGLRAVADELNRLRRHLRRIILVSHQEDFADRFPVVIKLSHGENGAVAEAVRR